jgi:hypothetical protein
LVAVSEANLENQCSAFLAMCVAVPAPDIAVDSITGLRHYVILLGIRSTRAISLWEIEHASPSSHEMVTSLQDVPITVPRSVVFAPQQTRSPPLSSLDWLPVIKICQVSRRTECGN